MFTTALFTTAKIQNHLKYLSTDEWQRGSTHKPIHTYEHYSAIKNNENLLRGATCMDLEDIMLSEINQTEKILYDIIYMWNLKKYNKLVNITKMSKTDRENKLMVTSGETEAGRGNVAGGYKGTHSTIDKTSYKEILSNTKNTDSIL